MTGGQVLFRVDATARMGGGHAMRCLTLANRLTTRGFDCRFAFAAMPDALRMAISAAGHSCHQLPHATAASDVTPDWDRHLLDDEAQADDATATLAPAGGARASWIIVDHYRLDARWETMVRAAGYRLLVIDDLANRDHDCDVLVDQTLGRAARDYAALVPAAAIVLAGTAYALLRVEFDALRPRALERRAAAASPTRVLVSLGSTDLGGVTAVVVRRLAENTAIGHIDVVLGGEASSLPEVVALARRDPRLRLHVESRNMADLIVAADLAVGAAGTSSWERCTLGLPTVTVVLAHNQHLVAERLAEAGAVILAPDPDEAGTAVDQLLSNPDSLARMSAAAFAVADGLGAQRVADCLAVPVPARNRGALRLRPARAGDSRMIWLWRNDPITRANAKHGDAIAWQEHADWFSRMLGHRDSTLMIAEIGGESGAMVRFDRADQTAAVSINVAPTARGRGVGKMALAAACDDYLRNTAVQVLIAEILFANCGSRRIFEAAGFQQDRRVSGPLLSYRRGDV